MKALVGALALAFVAACGTASTPAPASVSGSVSVLSAAAVPGLPYTTKPLTTSELSKDAAIPGLGSMLDSWGYVEGAERTFQGESRHLTFVVSRELVFRDAAGAAAYVAFVHSHAAAYFGVAGILPLDAQGRSGWQFMPSACACHMANPVQIGVVSSGADVSWLEINGPDATPALLVTLLDPAEAVPANS